MMRVLVMSDGDGDEANVSGGPNRNPPPKLNILPRLSTIPPKSLTLLGFFFYPTHLISHVLPGNYILSHCYSLALHIACRAFDQYHTSLNPYPYT